MGKSALTVIQPARCSGYACTGPIWSTTRNLKIPRQDAQASLGGLHLNVLLMANSVSEGCFLATVAADCP